MSKSPISAKFAKFAEKTTRGEFDKARQQESMASGCPLPVNTRGVAVVATIDCTETKVKSDGTGGDPFVSIKLEVESPEEYRGKTISGPGLMVVIKDGPNSTAADAWARMLDQLEAMGLPRETRTGYNDFSECIDYFTEQPRRVEFNVLEDTFKGNQSGKTVRCNMYVEPGEVSSAETPQNEEPRDPNADYCMYLGKEHKILERNAEEDTLDLEQTATGRFRPGVPADKVQLVD